MICGWFNNIINNVYLIQENIYTIRMKIIEYNKWEIEYDDYLTQKVYKSLTSGPEDCVCENCKNFLLAREDFYPEDFKKVLNQLGVDSKKEVEITWFNRIKPGWHLYSGWFHFVGNILKIPQFGYKTIYEQAPEFKNFAWDFSVRKHLISSAFEQNPVVQLEWIGLVSWVIDLPEPS